MKRLAILGGGQLAMMLSEAAARLGVPVRVLPTPEIADEKALRAVFSQSDVVTVENEFVDVRLLERVLAEFPALSFEPSLAAIWEAQDKLRQKRIFVSLGIETAPFEAFDPEARGNDVMAIEEWLDRVAKRFLRGAMLKWSRWGYDGKGNCPLRGIEDFAPAVEFCREGISRGAELYAEEWIPWESELAMVASRSRKGELVVFPLVLSFQERSVCREVRGPASRFGIPGSAASRATETIRKLGDRLGMTGTFAVEFFWTADGRMLANEMAPRVHNTGHYSRHSGLVSQFENHVRAVVGLPLVEFGVDPGSDTGPCFGMRNLLGPEAMGGFEVDPQWASKFLSKPGSDIEATWYGKTTAAPMRKMGHLTVTASSTASLELRMREMAEVEERFWREVRARAGR